MVYFDIRPSAHLPTVELRIRIACPAVDDTVLIAGLFRALVPRRCWSNDEAVGADGAVLPHYGWMFRTLDRLGARGMTRRASA